MVIYSACLHHNALLSLTDISSCMVQIAGILCLRGILRGNYTLKFSRHLSINIDAKNKVLYH